MPADVQRRYVIAGKQRLDSCSFARPAANDSRDAAETEAHWNRRNRPSDQPVMRQFCLPFQSWNRGYEGGVAIGRTARRPTRQKNQHGEKTSNMVRGSVSGRRKVARRAEKKKKQCSPIHDAIEARDPPGALQQTQLHHREGATKPRHPDPQINQVRRTRPDPKVRDRRLRWRAGAHR